MSLLLIFKHLIDNKKKRMLILQLILILVGVLAILVIKTDIIKLIPPCAVRSCFGIICPTCGVTRCINNILSLRFDLAFKYHPVFFLGVCYFIIVDLLYVVNTMFNKKFLNFLQPTYKKLTIFYVLLFFQYFYRLFVMLNYDGFQFL